MFGNFNLENSKFFKCSFRQKKQLFKVIDELVEMSVVSRSMGTLELEYVAAKISDRFMQYAIMLVVDANDSDNVRATLESYVMASQFKGVKLLRHFLIIEAVMGIGAGTNPRVIAEKLEFMLGEDMVRWLQKNKREKLNRWSDANKSEVLKACCEVYEKRKQELQKSQNNRRCSGFLYQTPYFERFGAIRELRENISSVASSAKAGDEVAIITLKVYEERWGVEFVQKSAIETQKFSFYEAEYRSDDVEYFSAMLFNSAQTENRCYCGLSIDAADIIEERVVQSFAQLVNVYESDKPDSFKERLGSEFIAMIAKIPDLQKWHDKVEYCENSTANDSSYESDIMTIVEAFIARVKRCYVESQRGDKIAAQKLEFVKERWTADFIDRLVLFECKK
jgi:hypothetical protein